MMDDAGPGESPGPLRAVVLGGYGVIGSAVMRRLDEAGFDVTGVGRSGLSARKADPDAAWEIYDITKVPAEAWRVLLEGVDVVVNASGALQDGGRDNLSAIHVTALDRLGEALAGTDTLVVQISAAGVSDTASTAFFRTKAQGEAALRASGVPLVILRPTLVLSSAAYGGTGLLRAAASIPFVLPRVFPKSQVQCVLIDDLVEAVLDAAEGRIAAGTEVDVTGPDAHTFPDLLARVRRWLGFGPAWLRLPVPGFAVSVLSRLADLAGRMGWRSPLRTTAVSVLSEGISGDAEALVQAGGRACRPLDQALRALPSTVQERWFARAYLMFPVAVLTLSLFWLLSGLIGAVSFSAAQEVLTSRGWTASSAGLAVILGIGVDLSLGALILWRSKVRRVALAMIGVSLAYLTGGTIAAPDLWADPLGPFVKVLPGIALALFVLALADDR